jgi:hypothetical protein
MAIPKFPLLYLIVLPGLLIGNHLYSTPPNPESIPSLSSNATLDESLEWLRAVYPSGYHLVTYSRESFELFQQLRLDKHGVQTVWSLSSALHETSHVFSRSWLQQSHGQEIGFYIKRHQALHLSLDPGLYNLIELLPYLPDQFNQPPLKTRCYHYLQTENAAQHWGIYGILDEWIAYLHNIKLEVLAKECFLPSREHSLEEIMDVFEWGISSRLALMEFCTYFLLYIQVATVYHPEHLTHLKENSTFINLIHIVWEETEHILQRFSQRMIRLREQIEQMGYQVITQNRAGIRYLILGKGNRGIALDLTQLETGNALLTDIYSSSSWDTLPSFNTFFSPNGLNFLILQL